MLEDNPEWPGRADSFQFLLHISWAPTHFQSLGWHWADRQEKDVVPAWSLVPPVYQGRQTQKR